MKNELPDWLGVDEEPEMSVEDIRKAWRNFIEADLVGKKILLACRGGDGHEITATIDKIISILGIGVVLKISDATIASQLNLEEDAARQPKDLPDASYVFLNEPEPPKFRDSDILLPSGGTCADRDWKLKFGGCLCIGFIYP